MRLRIAWAGQGQYGISEVGSQIFPEGASTAGFFAKPLTVPHVKQQPQELGMLFPCIRVLLEQNSNARVYVHFD